ncbi:MAG: JAB domain-containing protein [bacterium]
MKGKKKYKVPLMRVKLSLVRESVLHYQDRIGMPKDIVEMIRSLFEDLDMEKLVVVGLDSNNKPVIANVVSIGTIDCTFSQPRDVIKTLLLSNCVSFICAHNHPSGNLKPSSGDIAIAENLKNAGKLFGIRLLDNIILGHKGEYFSFSTQGII